MTTLYDPSYNIMNRLPQLSPIVPMLYWNSRANFDDIDDPHRTLEPMGSWGGHPTEVLDRLTEEIQCFEGFWETALMAREHGTWYGH